MTLQSFFYPNAVAVIGASRNPTKVGHVIFRNFFEGSFRGKAFPVNPNAEEIFGQKTYPSVLDIPGKIDLAIITIPAQSVPKALEECGKKKIRSVVIISAGFSEIGNYALDSKIKSIAKKHSIRLLGPNCLGVFTPSSGVDTLFLPRFKLTRPSPGNIAYISQSGATLSVVLDIMGMKGYKVSKAISYGNASDIDEADLISYLSSDPDTRVICCYFEGVRSGRKFFEAAKKCKKPIIALKGGQTPAGSNAALSHTGSLAGESRVYSAAFKQSGVVEVSDLEQIFDFARVLSTQPLPKGPNVQIITDGGGFGVLTADVVHQSGLSLSPLNPRTVQSFQKSMPSYVVLKNPLDLTGDADSNRYKLALEASIQDPNVHMIALVVLFQVPTLTPDVVEIISELKGKKPMVVISGGGKYTETLKKSLEDQGIPCFSYPDRAVSALRALYDHSITKK